MSKTKVIAFANNKGGSGKTTTVSNVGCAMARLGKRVLIIDADMQMNLTLSCFDEERALGFAESGKNIYTAIKEERDLADFIVPTDYEGTSCTRITRTDDIHRTNPNYRRNQSIKYALLAAIAAGAVTAVLIIIIDAQDKRLRDHEVISRKFKIPVLGIIPSIEAMNQSAEFKKQQKKGGKK